MSLTTKEAIEWLKMPGTKFSGSDWKYGWPHKFYIERPNPDEDKLVQVGMESRWEDGQRIERPVMGRVPHIYGKYYTQNLETASPEELEEFNQLSKKIFGIAWLRDEKGIKYRAPNVKNFYGWQRYGTIGENGEPVHKDGLPTDLVAQIIGEKDGDKVE